MRRRIPAFLLASKPPPLWAGVLAAVAAVTISTLIVYPLKHIAPAVSLGVVYLLGVLVISSTWGAYLGVATGLASAAAFNFFHLPPVGRFAIRESHNWVALVAFLIAAGLASSVAEVARARARDADLRRGEAGLAAEMARVLLRGERLDAALPKAAQRLAETLDLASAAIVLNAAAADRQHVAFPLTDRGRRLGTLLVPAETPAEALRRLRERVVPALQALLSAARERETLVSEVLETAALREADVIKTALLRAVSHDLRSPLTAIRAASESVGSAALTAEERRELASVIQEETRRLSRLVDDLLDLSRLEAGAVEPRREWMSVAEVIGKALAELGRPADRFAASIDRELPRIRADAAQLERAFVNVLDNARRYSGRHPVSVRARAVRRKVIVRVVDRGPGIPPAQLDLVFEPFFAVGTARAEHRGSGLGLAIARGFVEANGGRLQVESLPGQGATFVFELPLEPVPAVDEPRPAVGGGVA